MKDLVDSCHVDLDKAGNASDDKTAGSRQAVRKGKEDRIAALSSTLEKQQLAEPCREPSGGENGEKRILWKELQSSVRLHEECSGKWIWWKHPVNLREVSDERLCCSIKIRSRNTFQGDVARCFLLLILFMQQLTGARLRVERPACASAADTPLACVVFDILGSAAFSLKTTAAASAFFSSPLLLRLRQTLPLYLAHPVCDASVPGTCFLL